MRALVDDVLELTRLEAGIVHLRSTRCDLGGLARQAARAIEPMAAKRGQRVVLDFVPMRIRISVDAERLKRALVNLLSNAQRYGKEKGTIRLSLSRRGAEVLIGVADDGPGIPRLEQARIFERFYRASHTASRQRVGSGLGLPIARAMVELHGGRVWVESTAGAGATFWISLPTRQRHPIRRDRSGP
jgi:signal transduction histidine kinase